jgi:chemotaxis signal transduction protein
MNPMRKLLKIQFAGISYGLWADEITSIRDDLIIHCIPYRNGNPCFAGLVWLHDRFLAIADLSICLGYSPFKKEKGRILMLPWQGEVIGLVTSSKIEEVEISSESVLSLPRYIRSKVFKSCIEHNSELIPLIDVSALHLLVQDADFEPIGHDLKIDAPDPKIASSEKMIRHIESGGESIAIQASRIEDIITDPERISIFRGKQKTVDGLVQLNQKILPLVHLARRIVLPDESIARSVIVAHIGNKRVGVLVDEDRGAPNKKWAIESLPAYLQTNWMLEALMGKDEVIPIIDLEILVSSNFIGLEEPAIFESHHPDFSKEHIPKEVEVAEFNVLGTRHAIPKSEFTVSLDMGFIRRIPDFSPMVLGVAEYESQVYPVLDLANCYGEISTVTPDWKMVLIQKGEFHAFVVTEKFFGVRNIPTNLRRERALKVPQQFVYGSSTDKRTDIVIPILNVEKISAYYKVGSVIDNLPDISDEIDLPKQIKKVPTQVQKKSIARLNEGVRDKTAAIQTIVEKPAVESRPLEKRITVKLPEEKPLPGKTEVTELVSEEQPAEILSSETPTAAGVVTEKQPTGTAPSEKSEVKDPEAEEPYVDSLSPEKPAVIESEPETEIADDLATDEPETEITEPEKSTTVEPDLQEETADILAATQQRAEGQTAADFAKQKERAGFLAAAKKRAEQRSAGGPVSQQEISDDQTPDHPALEETEPEKPPAKELTEVEPELEKSGIEKPLIAEPESSEEIVAAQAESAAEEPEVEPELEKPGIEKPLIEEPESSEEIVAAQAESAAAEPEVVEPEHEKSVIEEFEPLDDTAEADLSAEKLEVEQKAVEEETEEVLAKGEQEAQKFIAVEIEVEQPETTETKAEAGQPGSPEEVAETQEEIEPAIENITVEKLTSDEAEIQKETAENLIEAEIETKKPETEKPVTEDRDSLEETDSLVEEQSNDDVSAETFSEEEPEPAKETVEVLAAAKQRAEQRTEKEKEPLSDIETVEVLTAAKERAEQREKDRLKEELLPLILEVENAYYKVVLAELRAAEEKAAEELAAENQAPDSLEQTEILTEPEASEETEIQAEKLTIEQLEQELTDADRRPGVADTLQDSPPAKSRKGKYLYYMAAAIIPILLIFVLFQYSQSDRDQVAEIKKSGTQSEVSPVDKAEEKNQSGIVENEDTGTGSTASDLDKSAETGLVKKTEPGADSGPKTEMEKTGKTDVSDGRSALTTAGKVDQKRTTGTISSASSVKPQKRVIRPVTKTSGTKQAALTPLKPKFENFKYVVKKGDYLIRVTKSFSLKWYDYPKVQKYNKILNADLIYPDQVIEYKVKKK